MAKELGKTASVALIVAATGIIGVLFWVLLDDGPRRKPQLKTDNRFVPPPVPEPLISGDLLGKTVTISNDSRPATNLRFSDVTSKRGIDFRHSSTRTDQRLMPEAIGAGCIAADFNNDGAADIFLVNSGALAHGRERRPEFKNRLYLNDGKGFFTDVSSDWNVGGKAYGMGGTAGDFDNDGRIDLYLTTYGGGDQLLRNMGDHFEDVTEASGIQPDQYWSSSAAFFDADQDGDLDLYVVRYVDYTAENAVPCYSNNIQITCAPHLYQGIMDRLLLNNGDGTFRDVSESGLLCNDRPLVDQVRVANGRKDADMSSKSIDLNACKGLAVGVSDVNGDGLPDIYVANDVSRNLLFINQGNAVFEEVGRLAGVAYGDSGIEQAGMGVDFTDVDGDGRVDIGCTNFQAQPANIYCQTSPMFFVDRTDACGVGQSSRQKLQFGIVFFDADNDGDEDLAIANGHIYDNVAKFLGNVTFEQANSLFSHDGKGVFKDVSESSGNAFADRKVSRGIAVADFDGDGRLDLLISNNDEAPQLALNESDSSGNFVCFLLEGTTSNRSAIGAVISLTCGDKRIKRELAVGHSYLSSSDLKVHLGIGAATEVQDVEIFWPGGNRQTIERLPANKFYRLIEGGSPEAFVPGKLSGN